MQRSGGRVAGPVTAASIAAVMGLSGSCRTVPRQEPQVVPSSGVPSTAPMPGSDASVPPPVLRVGILVDVARASIAADSGVLIRTSGPGPREERVARATFASLASAAGSEAGRFRVQVASLADPESAKQIGERAERIAGQPVQIRWNPETRTHQVRVGAFGTRPLAMGLVGRLHAGGMPGYLGGRGGALRRRAACGCWRRTASTGRPGPPGAARRITSRWTGRPTAD